MKFSNCNKYAFVLDDLIAPKDNDILVFFRVSQDFFNHSIVSDETSNLTRYSYTFRSLAPYNLKVCARKLWKLAANFFKDLNQKSACYNKGFILFQSHSESFMKKY